MKDRHQQPQERPSRQAHAVQDLASRKDKAVKIERILKLGSRPAGLRLLEIGCGTGGIAHYFGTHAALKMNVDAVDLRDERRLTDGYRFTKVTGTNLPFADESFDVVISNHVIEHVGGLPDQSRHLSELRRVLRRDGIGYLAMPNRWQLTEPHYRIKFLSWLPRSLRTPYLKLRRGGQWYDCEPLTMAQLESLLAQNRFIYANACVEAFRYTLEIENTKGIVARLVERLPDTVLDLLRPVIPTLIYTLTRA